MDNATTERISAQHFQYEPLQPTSPVVALTTPRTPHFGAAFRDCADCPEMIVLPAGSFTMGSPASESSRDVDEGPQQRITFARNFAVGRLEVTRGQYAAFTRATKRTVGTHCITDRARHGTWAQDPKGTWRDPGFAQGEDDPVVCVSWEDAQAYVQWLNTQTTGGYRLLSEAEWEYAARAGTTSVWIWGSDPNGGCSYANAADATAHASYPIFTVSTCNDGALYTAPAGSYRPNAFGLSDMIGNAWEWVADCYAATPNEVPSDGSARETASCSIRIYRGGGWDNDPESLRSASRFGVIPESRVGYGDLGFRVARTLN